MPLTVVFHKINTLSHTVCIMMATGLPFRSVTIHFEVAVFNSSISLPCFPVWTNQIPQISPNISEIHYFIRCAIDLLSVPVNGGNQVIDFIVWRKHNRLPDLSLSSNSPSPCKEYTIVGRCQFFSQSNANGNTHSLTSEPEPPVCRVNVHV